MDERKSLVWARILITRIVYTNFPLTLTMLTVLQFFFIIYLFYVHHNIFAIDNQQNCIEFIRNLMMMEISAKALIIVKIEWWEVNDEKYGEENILNSYCK